MSFWGIEVKPGKPFTHSLGKDRRRLHISQATLGTGTYTNKSLVQCNVGNKSPVLLCVLLPEKNESCHLDLEFDEVDEVIFSVIGPRSVHLTGYYLGEAHRHTTVDDDSDTFGEDIGDVDTERSNSCSDYNYEDSFINDNDIEICPLSPASISGVASIELMDCKLPENGRASSRRLNKKRRLKKKSHSKEADTNGSNCQNKIVHRRRAAQIVDSEDEDEKTISSLYKSDKSPGRENWMEGKVVEDTAAKSDKMLGIDDKIADKSKQTNGDTISYPDGEREVDTPFDPLSVSGEVGREVKAEKKKKRKERSKEVEVNEVEEGNSQRLKQDSSFKGELQEPADPKQKDGNTHHAVTEHHTEDKRAKKKRRKNLDEKRDAELPTVIKQEENVPPPKIEGKNRNSKLPKGLVMEDLEVGKSDEKVASSGKRVTIQYDVKLKEGGQIVRSSVECGPYKFRLGKGRVVEGLDIGIDGMREGGRRRLIVPPELGYGSKDNDLGVPPDSWLVIDVDLIRVH